MLGQTCAKLKHYNILESNRISQSSAWREKGKSEATCGGYEDSQTCRKQDGNAGETSNLLFSSEGLRHKRPTI